VNNPGTSFRPKDVMRRARFLFLALFAGSLVASAAPVSDAIKAPRPKGGEYFGLYLLNKKVGYFFSDLTVDPAHPDRAKSKSEFVMKANVGQKLSERYLLDERIYESKPGGRLLSLRIEQRGDGGSQILEGTSSPNGLRVVMKRPGQPNRVENFPVSRETIEDADQGRVVAHRQKNPKASSPTRKTWGTTRSAPR
jgi:hypothetical protein